MQAKNSRRHIPCRCTAAALAGAILLGAAPAVSAAQSPITPRSTDACLYSGFENGHSSLDLEKIAGYSAGAFHVDGGVMEIISYNTATGYAYAVNGQSGLLTVLPMSALQADASAVHLSGTDIDLKALTAQADPSFTYGDMTSVAISPDGRMLAAALQSASYADAGRIALFQCGSDGSLTLQGLVPVGVQPDMVTFADNTTVLSADEGEPRMGYTADTTDPKGSVSVVDVPSMTATVVDFTAFDSQRDALTAKGVILKKGTAPSVDLEPEYLAVCGNQVYVSLQEANAIAVLDLSTKRFTAIHSVGFEDYSITPVDIDKKDGRYHPQTFDSLMGIRMPDGIAAFQSEGKTYLLTANEGDSREWGSYLNEDERNFKDGKDTSPTGAITADNSGLSGKVVFFLTGDYDGLDSQKDYLYGGRSFTLFQVTHNGLEEVFTSADDFERLTAQYLPDSFNTSNDNNTADDRSGKKGPEAESVAVGSVDGKTYAFIALERTGGVMVYDITVPAQTKYVNYINSRDFTSIIPGSEEYKEGDLDKWVTGGDVAPEGFAFVSAQHSPTGQALLLTACEVSGTVAVYQLTPGAVQADSPAFSDVEASAWYHQAVTYVAQNGVMTGTGNNSFTPNLVMSRAMAAQVLYNLAGRPEAPAQASYCDVPADSWFAPAVQWVTSTGLMKGYSPQQFAPNDPLTREQLAAILHRHTLSQGLHPRISLDLSAFADSSQVSAWAVDGMTWALEHGLFYGLGGGILAPRRPATRAETAAVLYRMLAAVT